MWGALLALIDKEAALESLNDSLRDLLMRGEALRFCGEVLAVFEFGTGFRAGSGVVAGQPGTNNATHFIDVTLA